MYTTINVPETTVQVDTSKPKIGESFGIDWKFMNMKIAQWMANSVKNNNYCPTIEFLKAFEEGSVNITEIAYLATLYVNQISEQVEGKMIKDLLLPHEEFNGAMPLNPIEAFDKIIKSIKGISESLDDEGN